VTDDAREEGRGIGGMSRRTAAWLAWSLLALSVLLYVLFLVLGLTPSASVTGMSYFQASDVLVSIAFLVFVPVGADRLTPSRQRHRLDPLHHRPPRSSAVFRRLVRPLRAPGAPPLPSGRCGDGVGGCVGLELTHRPSAVLVAPFPRRSAAVASLAASSMAKCGVDRSGSRLGRRSRRVVLRGLVP
jgi:hypothetical protein